MNKLYENSLIRLQTSKEEDMLQYAIRHRWCRIEMYCILVGSKAEGIEKLKSLDKEHYLVSYFRDNIHKTMREVL